MTISFVKAKICAPNSTIFLLALEKVWHYFQVTSVFFKNFQILLDVDLIGKVKYSLRCESKNSC